MQCKTMIHVIGIRNSVKLCCNLFHVQNNILHQNVDVFDILKLLPFYKESVIYDGLICFFFLVINGKNVGLFVCTRDI